MRFTSPTSNAPTPVGWVVYAPGSQFAVAVVDDEREWIPSKLGVDTAIIKHEKNFSYGALYGLSVSPRESHAINLFIQSCAGSADRQASGRSTVHPFPELELFQPTDLGNAGNNVVYQMRIRLRKRNAVVKPCHHNSQILQAQLTRSSHAHFSNILPIVRASARAHRRNRSG